MNKKASRWAPLAGPATLVLLIAGFAVQGDTPDATKDSAAKVVKTFTDQGDGLFVGLALASLGVVAFVIFASHLRDVLGAAEGEDGLLPRVALAGAVILGAGLCFDSTLLLTLHEGADDIGPAGVQALALLYNNDFIPMATGMFIFLIGIGVPILRSGVLPKWMGAVALLLAVASLTPVGFVGFIGGGVLSAIMGVLMAVRAGRAAPAAA